MAKQKDTSAAPDSVDMNKVEEMMGPPPDATALSETDDIVAAKTGKKKKIKIDDDLDNFVDKKSTKTDGKKQGVGDAVKEFNDSLKAAMADMPGSPTTGKSMGLKVEDFTVDKNATVGELSDNLEAEQLKGEDTNLNADPYADASIDKAVDDIAASDADELLATEDDKKQAGDKQRPKFKKPGPGGFKGKLLNLWHKIGPKRFVIILIALLLIAAGVIPFSRYFVLNTAGVRASTNLSVTDGSSLQPLKNAKVKIDNLTAQTDSNGNVKISHLKLGPHTLTIEKTAYASITQKRTFGWGSNPLGNFVLKPTGNQYSFSIVDFLSNKPIAKAQVNSGEGDASSDEKGTALLSLDALSGDVSVKVSADGYREETVTLSLGSKQTKTVKLVPSAKISFISKRTGKYDVYTADADGQNVKKIVAGTGLERNDIFLLPEGGYADAALVASRENVHNSEGFLLDTLYIVNLSDGGLTKVDQSESIKLVGWTSERRLVYVKTISGTSAGNPKRERLISYNASTHGDSKELASSNYFNDIYLANDKVYYAPSSAYVAADAVGTFRVSPDGANKTSLLELESWNIYRFAFDGLMFNTYGQWYSQSLTSDTPQKASTPGSLYSRVYQTSPDKKHQVWVDSRDGKNLLLSYDPSAKKDTTLATKANISQPFYWINNKYVVFRVADNTETADYAVNVDGGNPVKVSDVTNVVNLATVLYVR